MLATAYTLSQEEYVTREALDRLAQQNGFDRQLPVEKPGNVIGLAQLTVAELEELTALVFPKAVHDADVLANKERSRSAPALQKTRFGRRLQALSDIVKA